VESDISSLAVGAIGVDKADMARRHLPPSDVALAVIAALILFVVAIIARDFWLSLILGVIGAATFVYAVFQLRKFEKSLPEDDSGAA
jgi:hypothetical protein